ncbi:diaminopimelate decarboxylase [Phenylobacterium sp.]|uniref:diaminopimelate decarboxylase n=1 Tax=Phenylobacterium sp. TaxID=1871053 RepID=UPI00301BBF3C
MSEAARRASDPAFWWTRDDLAYVDGRLVFAGVDVAAAADEALDPLYLYSAPRVGENLDRLAGALSALPGPARVYYAMKANRFIPLLETMARQGRCGVDICSPDEMDRALAAGFAAQDISFTGTGVSDRDLDRLLAHPDLHINCDSVSMIRRIGARAPGRAIGLRVNPERGVGYGGSARLTYAGAEVTKFGVYRPQWPDAVAAARAHGLRLTTLHFHVGCGYLDRELADWEAAVEAALEFLDLAPDVTTVNVGGGLGLPQQANDAPLDLARWAAVIARRISARGLSVAVEPGDYLVKDAGLLVLEVTDVEVKRDELFASVAGGFNLAPEPAHYARPCAPLACVLREPDPGRWRPTTVAGNINEALDIWARGAPLPPLAGGDRIALLHTGGYGASMSSNHCMRGATVERLLYG